MDLDKVSIDEILEAQRVEQENEAAEKKRREQILQKRGLLTELAEDIYSWFPVLLLQVHIVVFTVHKRCVSACTCTKL